MLTLALVACTVFTAFAQGAWNCPVHGKKCPWVKNHGYCHHYDMYGYTAPKAGAPHKGCCWW